jgi:aryl-alcohol dehydrogenase-like predicted oxidoreductase
MENLKLSPLGFGCASVMGKKGKKESLQAMELSFDLGVTHFDIARSYGFGRAEGVLGHFLGNKRDQCTITSKFGVVPPNLSWKNKVIMPVVRGISKQCPSIQKVLKKKSGTILANKCFDLEYAKTCLDQTLKNLKTDYLDFYLLHEPDIIDLDNLEVLNDFFEHAIAAGKIKQFGIAVMDPLDATKLPKTFGSVMQFEANISTIKACSNIQDMSLQKLTTRPFQGGDLFFLKTLLEQDNELKDFGLSAQEIALALSRYISGQHGTTVCSMFSPEHIKSNVKAMEKISTLIELQQAVYQATLRNI